MVEKQTLKTIANFVAMSSIVSIISFFISICISPAEGYLKWAVYGILWTTIMIVLAVIWITAQDSNRIEKEVRKELKQEIKKEMRRKKCRKKK